MGATQWEKQLYGSGVEVVQRQKDCTIYRIADQMGEVVMTCYAVFPGIDLIYNRVNTLRCAVDVKSQVCNVIEIEHCREGRFECQLENKFFYLAPGDISVHRQEAGGLESLFPLKNYQGITIMLNLDETPECLSCILDDVNVQPNHLAEKFCGENNCFILRKNEGLAHVFKELYAVPEGIQKGYLKVKALEILLLLSAIKPQSDAQKLCLYSEAQVVLAKAVCQYLLKHMDRRITISQLAAHFNVSPTQLKNSFRGVYGDSVYSYIRTQKMQAAAALLGRGNDKILDIAGKFGYENGSKFAKAFSGVMGMPPGEYRREILEKLSCERQDMI